MSNKLHGDLVEADGLHEPKGVAVANEGEVYQADGAGSGVWGPIAWDDSFTPVITSITGSITASTSSFRYKKMGSLVFFECDLTITNNGTGGGGVQVTLPFNCLLNTVVAGREIVTSGYMCQCILYSGIATVLRFDNGYPVTTNSEIVFSGVYETDE